MSELRGFVQGFKQSLRGESSLESQIIKAVASGGSYRFLRVHDVEGQRRALFRLTAVGGEGLNYQDLVLLRGPSGQIKVVDLYLYLTGEMMSQGVRRYFAMALEPDNVWQRLSGRSSLSKRDERALMQVTAAVKTGNPRQVLAAIDRLPDEMKKDKTFLMLRVQTAQKLGDAEYMAAIEAFRRHHPTEPCLDMILMDWHVMRNEWDKAEACIQRLDQAVGGDPYLKVIRAFARMGADDVAGARRLAEEALAADADLADAHLVLVLVATVDGNADEVRRRLTTMDEKFQIDWERMRPKEAFTNLMKTPAFVDWYRSRRR